MEDQTINRSPPKKPLIHPIKANDGQTSLFHKVRDSKGNINYNPVAESPSTGKPNPENLPKSRQSAKKMFVLLVSHKLFEFLIISLTLIYCGIVFLTLFVQDPNMQGSFTVQQYDNIVYVCQVFEMVILIVFIVEICVKIYAFGFKKYFSDKWLIADAVIIFLSVVLATLDLFWQDSSFGAVSKVLRVFFRFLRIFLIFRKVSNFKKIKTKYARFDIKSPVEKCLEILTTAKGVVENNLMLKDIEWCMEMIASNKLYLPLLDQNNQNKENKEKTQELLNWINNYNCVECGGNDPQNNPKPSPVNAKTITSADNLCLRSNSLLIIPPEFEVYWKDVNTLDFNCFKFDEIAKDKALVMLVNYLFSSQSLCAKVGIAERTLGNFTFKVQEGYRDNPYHNRVHAFDVCQTTHFFLHTCKFQSIADLSAIEIASMYLAAAVHDYDHPGFNNNFLIATRDPIAIRYNDKSVLENYHIASTWSMALCSPETDIFQEMSSENYKRMRERMIGMVLATDMNSHFSDLAKLKGRLSNIEFNPKDQDKVMCIEALMHSADISNPIKPFAIYSQWTERVLAEFFGQGDQEREAGFPVSYLMDRFTVNKAKSQIGFIDVIVQPHFEVVKNFLPELQKVLRNLETNRREWEERVETCQEEMKEKAGEDKKKSQMNELKVINIREKEKNK